MTPEINKIQEVNKIFTVLKFEDLDDLTVFHNLAENGQRALESVEKYYKKNAFNMIYLGKPSYQSIVDHLEVVTKELKITKSLYDSKCNDIFKIETDPEIIEHGFKDTIENQGYALGSLARPGDQIDEEIK